MRGIHQIRIGKTIASADSSLDLIQLTQSEVVSIFNQNRVGIGNINTGFNDGRTDKHLIFIICKLQHDILDILSCHLPVRNTDFHLRHGIPKLSGHIINFLYIIVQIEHLSVSGKLTLYDFLHHLKVLFDNIGLYRHTVHRRGFQLRQGTDTNQRHLQGTRNRCCT